MNEDNKNNKNEQLYINGEETTLEEINEMKKKLNNSFRIVETTPGTYHLIERMEG